MLDQKIQDGFNEQLNAELFSSYLYLSMSAYLENQNLKGMAHWMRLQAQEEHDHAMKFFDYLPERGGRVILTKMKAPPTEWSSPLDVFEGACQHECKVTGMINDLVSMSLSEKDHAANAFLQWFVTEQVEEEASAQEIVDKLKLVQDNQVALFMIDQELGKRVVSPTAAQTEK